MKKYFTRSMMFAILILAVAFAPAASYAGDASANANAGASAVTGDSSAGFTGDVGSNNTYEASDLNRGRAFANPGDVQYGPVINYFGQPLPSEGFQPVEDIIMYSCWFTEGALESMLKGVEKADAEFKVANENVADAAPAPEDGETRWIKIVISRAKYTGTDFAFKGFITAKSEHRDTTMVEVVAKAALSAVQNGCNVIHFTAQGAVRDVMASGWGIGFNTTQAQVYGGDLTKSNVSSGGFGYSSAQAGTRDLGWVQGVGLIDYTLTYPKLKVAAAE